MREDKEIFRKFEAAISTTWTANPIAGRKAANMIRALVDETTDADERAIIEAFANLMDRRAYDKEVSYRKAFGAKS